MITVKIKEENSGVNELSAITVEYLLELLSSHKNNYLTITELRFDNYVVTNIDKLASVLL